MLNPIEFEFRFRPLKTIFCEEANVFIQHTQLVCKADEALTYGLPTMNPSCVDNMICTLYGRKKRIGFCDVSSDQINVEPSCISTRAG